MNAPQVRKSLFSKPERPASPETFAIVVTGYDTKSAVPTVTGRRIDTGEEAIVFLRDDPDIKTNGKYARPSIEAFAKPRKTGQDPSTAIGGTLVIQDAQKLKDGSYGARWIASASHNATEAQVFIATVHLTPVMPGSAGKQSYMRLNFLHDFKSDHLTDELKDLLNVTPPFKVENADDLRNALTEAVEVGIGAGVRLSTEEGFDGLFVTNKRDAKPEQVVADLMNRIPADYQAEIGKSVTAEIIPYGTLFAGPATRKVWEEGKREQSIITRFNKTVEVEGQQPRINSMYQQAIVAVRLTDANDNGERSVYFTMVEPTRTRAPVSGLNNAIAYAQTDHLAPVAPWPTSKAAPANDAAPADQQAPAGSATPAPAESFDASDDDLMGAALHTAGMGNDDMGAPIDVPSNMAPIELPKDTPNPAGVAAAQTTQRAARRFGARA